MLYSVGKIKKLSTTFIQIILTDSVAELVKTGPNQNCSRIPYCTETSNLNSHISQLITDNIVILEELERYESLRVPRKILNIARTDFEMYQIYCRLLQRSARDKNRILTKPNYLVH